jgi:hypothetical protein
MIIMSLDCQLLFSNNLTKIYEDSVITCKVKISKIEYSEKDSIFFISAINIETNKRYLIISNCTKCKKSLPKIKIDNIYNIDIKYIFGPNQIISNNDYRLLIYNKSIIIQGFYFSYGVLCTSSTIDLDFCIPQHYF